MVPNLLPLMLQPSARADTLIVLVHGVSYSSLRRAMLQHSQHLRAQKTASRSWADSASRQRQLSVSLAKLYSKFSGTAVLETTSTASGTRSLNVTSDYACNPNNWGRTYKGSGGMNHNVKVPVEHGISVSPGSTASACAYTTQATSGPREWTCHPTRTCQHGRQ